MGGPELVKDCGPNGCSNHPATVCTKCGWNTWDFVKETGGGYTAIKCRKCGEITHYNYSKQPHWCSRTIIPPKNPLPLNKDSAAKNGKKDPGKVIKEGLQVAPKKKEARMKLF
jgi:hypothetical protein